MKISKFLRIKIIVKIIVLICLITFNSTTSKQTIKLAIDNANKMFISSSKQQIINFYMDLNEL